MTWARCRGRCSRYLPSMSSWPKRSSSPAAGSTAMGRSRLRPIRWPNPKRRERPDGAVKPIRGQWSRSCDSSSVRGGAGAAGDVQSRVQLVAVGPVGRDGELDRSPPANERRSAAARRGPAAGPAGPRRSGRRRRPRWSARRGRAAPRARGEQGVERAASDSSEQPGATASGMCERSTAIGMPSAVRSRSITARRRVRPISSIRPGAAGPSTAVEVAGAGLQPAGAHVLGERGQPQRHLDLGSGHERALALHPVEPALGDQVVHRLPDGHPGQAEAGGQLPLGRDRLVRGQLRLDQVEQDLRSWEYFGTGLWWSIGASPRAARSGSGARPLRFFLPRSRLLATGMDRSSPVRKWTRPFPVSMCPGPKSSGSPGSSCRARRDRGGLPGVSAASVPLRGRLAVGRVTGVRDRARASAPTWTCRPASWSPAWSTSRSTAASGSTSSPPTRRGWAEVSRRLPETGVTSFVPTFITAPVAELVAALRRTPRCCRTCGARVLGVHVEGPFLRPPGTARTTRRCCATRPRRPSTR